MEDCCSNGRVVVYQLKGQRPPVPRLSHTWARYSTIRVCVCVNVRKQLAIDNDPTVESALSVQLSRRPLLKHRSIYKLTVCTGALWVLIIQYLHRLTALKYQLILKNKTTWKPGSVGLFCAADAKGIEILANKTRENVKTKHTIIVLSLWTCRGRRSSSTPLLHLQADRKMAERSCGGCIGWAAVGLNATEGHAVTVEAADVKGHLSFVGAGRG